MRCRLFASAAILMLAMMGLGVRLAFLHLGPNEQARSVLKKASRLEQRLAGERGRIYDRRGGANILALNLAAKDVCAAPCAIVQCTNVAVVASRLAEALDLDTDAVAVKLNRPDRKYARIAKSVRGPVLNEIKRLDLQGVFFRDATVRHYPQGCFMCHVLGFVDDMGVGRAGVERQSDRYLRGCPGLLESRKDALRQELYGKRGRYMAALRGADIQLTIDQHIQYFVEKALDELVEEHNPKGAWAIVERVRTGEILAMASRPSFDPNRLACSTQNTRLNRAIGWVYEPGSTLKAAVISAALNENLVTPHTIVDCENGSWFYANRPLGDAHPYGRLSVADVLKKSSNIGTAKLALMLGNQRLEKYLRRLYIGRRLGVDLPLEEAGILHPARRWSAVSPTRIAIGQGVAVTALQMLGVLCAIANDGALMKPYVISSIRSSDGTSLHRARPEVLSRPITPATAATMRILLARVTEQGGTGRHAGLEGYRVAGKTGTAQKPKGGGYSSTAFTASFTGFLPAEDPEIAIIVVADEPQPQHYGGVVAGPTFKKIARQAVKYLDIPSVHEHLVAKR